jgi:Tol biopolymer transport system component/DNA-binding winged helix-turn-helix (wHTH) protein
VIWKDLVSAMYWLDAPGCIIFCTNGSLDMSSQSTARRLVRFGLFELDLAEGELRKQGRKIRLQDQPFQVLELLLIRPGELVTREELQKALWPADTFVEFDQGLNTAIKKIRLALGDSADNPRFIETIPRKGYRFIAPVELAPREASTGPQDVTSTPRRSRRRFTLLWASAVAALLVAAGVWFVRSRTAKPEPSLVAVPLTTYPGIEDTPSFSPDGTQVAFQWCPENSDQSCHIYIKQVGVELPFQLTNNPARDSSPAWSPDGQTIAFLRILTPTKWGLILIPQRGGRERVLEEIDVSGVADLIEEGSLLAWAPDSKWIVLPEPNEQGAYGLSLLSVETGEKRRLTSPAAEVCDRAPAFSPDGHTLAFTRVIAGRADLYVLHLAEGYKSQGEPERLALDNLLNTGAAWTADGGDVVFSSGTADSSGLWRLPVRNLAALRRLAFASDHAYAPSVSRQGNRLAYVVGRFDNNVWRVDLRGPGGKPGSPAQFISSTRSECCPWYSPDGKKIAFVSERSGAHEVWVCDSDGSNPVPLTSFG